MLAFKPVICTKAQKRGKIMKLTAVQQADIETARGTMTPTRRATVPALEEILYSAFPVLDHGFIRVIDYMGDDSAMVQAARVSYGKGTKTLSSDAGLINYLMRNRHTTPFEMCEIKYHVKLPIFVARQWIRHRTANVNEYSARYSILDKEFYTPTTNHLSAQSKTNHQGRGEVLGTLEAERVLQILKEDSARCYENYEEMLNERDGEKIYPDRDGLAREIARMNLPLNIYTQWYWKIDLHNLMHFLSLRADPHAQYEIRAYAEVMADIFKSWLPLTYEAFDNCIARGVRLSGNALMIIQKILSDLPVSQQESGLGKREWDELMSTFGIEFD